MSDIYLYLSVYVEDEKPSEETRAPKKCKIQKEGNPDQGTYRYWNAREGEKMGEARRS